MRMITIAAAAVLLAGCSASGPVETAKLAAQVPPDYRAQIIRYVQATMKDPYSIRSAEISGPTSSFVGLVNGGSAPGVCLRMNGKNSFGAYIGVQTYSVAFRNGQVLGITEPLFGTCQDVTFAPFPELEGAG